ncbi:MAG: MotA/TolQ/ExbB proton channel family protein, partial [Pedobacter sp.]
MANAPKPTTVKKESSSSASNVFATLVIPICIVIGFIIWRFVLGDPANFIDNNNENLPLPNNYPGTA